MKQIFLLLTAATLLAASCTSQKKLAYLNNLPETPGETYFPMDIPDYKIQNRDILHITVKAMAPDGRITDYFSMGGGGGGAYISQGESGGYMMGYDVKNDGNILLPIIGTVQVEGKTLEEIRNILQAEFSKSYKNATVECKLLSFKFTVIGEVNGPGTFMNYNNYLTVLEAIGRAGGVGDFGRRDKVLVVRPSERGTKTYRLNLQDKQLLTSEAYFLLPNDVVIIEPVNQKIFQMNLPTISFIMSTFTGVLSTTLLLINYLGK